MAQAQLSLQEIQSEYNQLQSDVRIEGQKHELDLKNVLKDKALIKKLESEIECQKIAHLEI